MLLRPCAPQENGLALDIFINGDPALVNVVADGGEPCRRQHIGGVGVYLSSPPSGPCTVFYL